MFVNHFVPQRLRNVGWEGRRWTALFVHHVPGSWVWTLSIFQHWPLFWTQLWEQFLSLPLYLFVSFFLVPVSFSSVLIFIMLCDSLPSLPSLLCHQLFSLNKVIKLSTLFSLVCILTWQVYFLSVALKENMGLLKKKVCPRRCKSQPVGKSNQRNTKPIWTHRTTFSSQTNTDPASKDGKNFMGWISRIVKGEMSRWKNEKNCDIFRTIKIFFFCFAFAFKHISPTNSHWK